MDRALTFVIDMDARDLPMEDLASLMILLEKALYVADPRVSSKYDLKYSVIALEPGSTALAISANNLEVGEKQVQEFTRQMADPIKKNSVRQYKNLQNKCNELNTKISVSQGGSKKPSLYLVPEPPLEQTTIRGGTTIYGVLERIGGSSTIAANVRQHGMDKVTTVTLSKELAKKMAPYLYSQVRLEGEAEWDISTLEVVSFKVTSFTSFNPGTIDETLDELAKLTAGGLWNESNQTIEDFLYDLRGREW